MKKILLSFVLCFFALPGIAVDCQDKDEKFVKIEATKIGTDMYDKKMSAEKIEKISYKSVEGSYTSGRWSLQNEKDKNLNVVGVSICTDTDESLNFKSINRGNYCWCNLESVDNYRVSSKWKYVKEYNEYTNILKNKEKIEKEKNIQDCLDNCATTCQTKYSSLIHSIDGSYICEKSLYKLENVRCVINGKFINAKQILVFDDIAEIQMLGGGSIIFTKGTANKSDYVGEYESGKIYLTIKNGGIYIGDKAYSMEQCL